MTTEEILLELDSRHHRLSEALGKDKPTPYSRAADEIRRLVDKLGEATAQLNKTSDVVERIDFKR